MSPDVIGMIIALFAFTLTVLGGVAGLLARQTSQLDGRFAQADGRFAQVDARFDRLEQMLDSRFAQVDARFSRAEVDADSRFTGLAERLSKVESELVEVKVAIARIEGPRRHLQQL